MIEELIKGKTLKKIKIPRYRTGIDLLDELLPEGMPATSFITLSGEGGTGKSVILQQLAINFLRKCLHVIYLTSDDSPFSIEDNMSRFGWRPRTYRARGKLIYIDCFSWRIHPKPKGEPGIIIVDSPTLSNITSVLNLIVSKVPPMRSVLIIDSLTDVISTADPSTALDTIKTWRANLTKARGILTFASFHFGIKAFDEVEQVIDYIVDGVIDLRYDPYLMQQGVLVRQIRIRKLKGARHTTAWIYYNIYSKEGVKKMDKSEVARLLTS